MTAIIQPLISLIVLGVIFYLLYWLVSQIPLPTPFAVVAKVILGIAAILAVLKYLTPYIH